MPADTQIGSKRGERASSVGRVPAVGVVAPCPAERRLTGILERDGLYVAVSNSTRRLQSLDVIVLAVETVSNRKSDIRRVRNEHPSARLVLVVGTATPAEVRQLLVDDVPGLVFERHIEKTLALAVRVVFAGQISYPAQLMPTQLRAGLSNREKQILGMVVMGFSNAEIAAKLYVSESTVKSHVSSAFATIGVRTRKEAVALILDPDAGFGTGILAITDSG